MEYLPVVIDASYVSDYKIKITFDNSEEKTVDFTKWLGGGVFEALKDKNYFQKFFVDGWSISWPNGADVDPETLYMESQSISTIKAD